MIRSRILLLLPLSLLAACANTANWGAEAREFEPGTWRIGGDLGVFASDDEFNNQNTDILAVSGDLGYFFWRSLELGVGLDFQSTDAGANDTEDTSLYVYGRYYTHAAGDFRPFVEAGGGSVSRDTGSLDVNGERYFAGLGVQQYVSERVAFEATIAKTVSDYDFDIEGESTDFRIGLSVLY